MSELECTYREPLKIRGHHLPVFWKCVALQVQMNSVEGAAQTVVSDLRTSFYEKEGNGYRVDVLGENCADVESHWDNHKELLIRFLTLPKDYLVRILQGEKDNICNLCKVGDHCLNPVEGEIDALIADVFGISGILTLGELKQKLLELPWLLS